MSRPTHKVLQPIRPRPAVYMGTPRLFGSNYALQRLSSLHLSLHVCHGVRAGVRRARHTPSPQTVLVGCFVGYFCFFCGSRAGGGLPVVVIQVARMAKSMWGDAFKELRQDEGNKVSKNDLTNNDWVEVA